MLAKDIMTRHVTTVRPNLWTQDLARIFAQRNISGAPVLDENGKVAGIVSDGDILSKEGVHVGSLMTKQVISVTEDDPVKKIAELMIENKIKRVPVLRGEELVGIVSRADIIRAIAMGKPIYDS